MLRFSLHNISSVWSFDCYNSINKLCHFIFLWNHSIWSISIILLIAVSQFYSSIIMAISIHKNEFDHHVRLHTIICFDTQFFSSTLNYFQSCNDWRKLFCIHKLFCQQQNYVICHCVLGWCCIVRLHWMWAFLYTLILLVREIVCNCVSLELKINIIIETSNCNQWQLHLLK